MSVLVGRGSLPYQRPHNVDYDSSLCPKTFFSFFVTFIPIMFSIQAVTSGKHEFE